VSQERRALQLIVNQVARAGVGRAIRAQLQQVLDRYVASAIGAPLRLELLGEVPIDAAVRESVQRRQLMLALLPGAPAAVAVRELAARLGSERAGEVRER
jgi:flagellar biosynthesis protein FlhG